MFFESINTLIKKRSQGIKVIKYDINDPLESIERYNSMKTHTVHKPVISLAIL